MSAVAENRSEYLKVTVRRNYCVCKIKRIIIIEFLNQNIAKHYIPTTPNTLLISGT